MWVSAFRNSVIHKILSLNSCSHSGMSEWHGLHKMLFPCLVNRGFWPLAHSQWNPCSSQSLPSDRTAGVLSSICTVTERPRSWTYTCASSFVCTSSSLAVTTVVEVPPFSLVSISSELKSFLLSMCFVVPESTTNSRSSGDFEVGARGVKRSFFSFFELVDIFCQVPCCSADASFLVQIWEHTDCAREVHSFEWGLAMDPFFP